MKKEWWHDKVAYQIYPKSFKDTNGDGIGDIRGIIEKLDYLKDLGIDIIWISPMYKSPFVDQGYDISDYYSIAPEFGTMEDFDELLEEAKKRNINILMDLVINHCSDKHEWFQNALKDPYGEYAEYFYFEKGKNGNPPSNYRSYFGGSAWEPVEGIGEMLEELKGETFEKYNAFTVAEVFNNKEEELEEFIGENGHFSTMFDFSAEVLNHGDHGWYDAKKIEFDSWRNTIFESQRKSIGKGFLANIIENHDEPRGASRYLPDYAQNDEGVKMLATVSILLRGIPFIYQGQEIGMRNCPMDSIDEYDDIHTKDQYEMALKTGLNEEEALKVCYKKSRDNSRTPMQWNNLLNAGFTDGNPWLKVNPNYIDINVEKQKQDDNSILNYYRNLIALRKCKEYKEIFTYGDFEPEYLDKENIFSYYRKNNDKSILIVANFGKEDSTLKLKNNTGKLLLSNVRNKEICDGSINLKSCEVAIILFDDNSNI